MLSGEGLGNVRGKLAKARDTVGNICWDGGQEIGTKQEVKRLRQHACKGWGWKVTEVKMEGREQLQQSDRQTMFVYFQKGGSLAISIN